MSAAIICSAEAGMLRRTRVIVAARAQPAHAKTRPGYHPLGSTGMLRTRRSW